MGPAASGLAVFAFGKLPAHGDFVARGLGAAERQAWDDWASAGVSQARERLGSGFDAAHDRAQPWRFAFGPGRFGPGRRAGALAASVDAAGRRFLIVVGAQAPAGLAPQGAGARAAEILEDQIYRAFAEGADIDRLTAGAAEALADLDPGLADDAGGRFWTLGSGPGDARDIHADAPPPELLSLALFLPESRHG
jgi:type VI secretion system ImpM family protein